MLRWIRNIICLFCMAGGWGSLQAQSPGLYFEHISYDEDFSPSMISCLAQSSKGFVWIGTENGLFRYDGYRFYRYVRDKTQGSLSNNHVNTIFEDSEGTLWVGTNHGVNHFDKNADHFSPVDVSMTKGGRNYISSFTEDDAHNVWVGTFGGIKKLNKKEKLLENITSDSNFELNKSRVLSLFYDKDYGVFAGTAKGLKCFDPATSELRELPEVLRKNKSFLKAKIWKMVREPDGKLWFGTETMGAFLYSPEKNTLARFAHQYDDPATISSNWVNDIITVDASTTWFATKDGLSVYDKNSETFRRYRHHPLNNSSLTDNDIQCFLKDRYGCIWAGTMAGGINFYNKANSNFIHIGETTGQGFGLNNSIVRALTRENDHALWAGTYGGGLTYLDLEAQSSVSYMIEDKIDKKTKNAITALARKDKDHLVCGTLNGLYEFDQRLKKFTPVPLSANGGVEDERPITSLLADGEEIWVGTDGNGLKRVLKNGSVEHYLHDRSSHSLSDNFIMDLENSEEGIWISTQNGLNYFDKSLKKVTRIYRTGGGPSSIGNNSLTVLFTDSKGRLWIGGDYDGLFCYDHTSDTFSRLNKEKGFTNAAIKSITEDARGHIWVSSEDFLFQISIKGTSATLGPDDYAITRYAAKDGVSVKQFSFKTGNVLNERQLVFGSTRGLIVFEPDELFKTPNDSEIVLTKLIINNETVVPGPGNGILKKTISETSEIIINHDQGYIGLEFSSLDFINPGKSRYAYKLDDGLRADEWHDTGTQNRINLSNLNPGDYILSIKSTNEDNGWNPRVKTLQIRVLPPWWKTWWAYLIYGLVLILFGLGIFVFINNRVKLKRRMFLEHVESERKQEMLDMQLNFFTNISHEIRTPLTLIKGPVEELLSASGKDPKTKKKLKTIQQNSDRLLKLVNELLDFRKSEKGLMRIYCKRQDIVSFCFEIYESFRELAAKKNIEYKFVLNSNSIQVYFDRDQLEKVIFNLLSNAFKFTGKNGKIVFAVEQQGPDKVLIKIKDNGIGIPEHSKDTIFNRFFQVDNRGIHNMGSGVGLALSKTIVELHQGEITVPDEKESWANTVFQITLLLGKDHLNPEQISEGRSGAYDMVIDSESVPSKSQEVVKDDQDEDVVFKAFDPGRKTIFIIEDNDQVRIFVNSILSDTYNVMDFSNAGDAMSYMEKEIPDLIISDIMMPEMDGLEFCTYLKTNESTNHIPVILLTAKASVDHKVEGLSTGADAYISKPFSTRVLMLSIQNLLNSKEVFRRKYSGNFIVNSDLDTLTTPEELFLKKLMKIIGENIENPDFDVSMLIDKIGMSRTVLYKKVNTLTNHSVASLIKQVRLKKAAEIISRTTYPISEVAFMVGFNDRKHFSREFKKVYKVSPTDYKNSDYKAG
ncbi:Signal transduction histidine kinase [Sinomicrobium oceani]|uniref:histidine kinase n=1 Tax=Sinomicrobium oceani TaxID=1150368 RepID=A0A1K1MXK2_9FLAO|nr:hybrid sensor histidine kinase/response regulator transcription factor [Sinomicrobium oceani]SFW26718.1 Signal transduction histidine kinase [Sinomicrobium oceani]